MAWDNFIHEANGFSLFAASEADALEQSVHRAATAMDLGLERQEPGTEADGCFELHGLTGTLRVSWMLRRKRGGRLDRTLLGALNWVRSATPKGPATREDVSDRLLETKVLVGFAADPPIESSSDPRFSIITSAAAAADGLVFNGLALAGANGAMLVEAVED